MKNPYRRRKFQCLTASIICLFGALVFETGGPPLGGGLSFAGLLMMCSVAFLGVTLVMYGMEIGSRASFRYYGVTFTNPKDIARFKWGWVIGGTLISLLGVVISGLAMLGV